MESVTLGVAIAACALILLLKPLHGLIVYLALVLFYPSYLAVSIGTIDLTAERIAVSILLLKCLADSNLKKQFKWCRLDTWVMAYFIISILIMCITLPIGQALENRAGGLMDTWFLYLITRLCIENRDAVLMMAKWIGVILVPLAALGIVEAFTGYQPFAALATYCPWDQGGGAALKGVRFGFTRAAGPCGHAITFGLAFSAFLPIVYYVRHSSGLWRRIAYFMSAMTVMGALSSMSSVPWSSLVTTITCLLMESFKQYTKQVLIGLAICVILAAVVSNRPIHYVIFSYINIAGGAGWHRAKLIDVAAEHFDEWYLLGYGERDPGWGEQLGSGHTDVTNEFIFTGVRFGIWGVIALCCILTSAAQRVFFLHRVSKDPRIKSLAWAWGTMLVGTASAFMGVSIVGQMISIFYFTLGMIGSSINLISPQRINFCSSQIISKRMKA
jgi:hypothetical protein